MIKKGLNVNILTGKDKNKVGEIIETRPISKTKRFTVLEEKS